MRKANLFQALPLLAVLSAPALLAHNVYPFNNVVYLSPKGPLGDDVVVQHFPFESCVVTASASLVNQPASALVALASGPNSGLDVFFFVSALRAPKGDSESVKLSGSWKATGSNTDGQPDKTCEGSGLIDVTITVFADKPPAPPTVSVIFVPGYVIDPVSTATGELAGYDESPDLDLGGPLDLSFRRYYASLLSTAGVKSALGPNWMHNFDIQLYPLGNLATVTLFRGKNVTFTLNNGAWQLSSTEQRPYQLVAAGSGYQFMSPVSNLIYSFNSTGALTAIADRNGNTLTVTQNPNGAGPSLVSDGLGRSLTFTYNGIILTGVKDQTGRSVAFAYDGISLVGATDANGKQTTFSYTGSGAMLNLMAGSRRPAGNQPFTQTYDAAGRVATQADSFLNTMTLSYAAGGGGATLTETAGVSLTHANDANLNVTAVSDPAGGIGKFTYDSNGRPASTIDRLGKVSMATWDAASGFAATYTDELGNTTSLTYTASTAGGFTFYDLTGIRFADTTTISLTRDSKGNITALTDQSGNIWKATFTANGSLATLTNPSGGVFTLSYNSDGTEASVRTPASDTTAFAYDSLSRLNSVTNPDSTKELFQYDAVSNLTGSTDERNKSVGATYDGNNNAKTKTDALAATTTYAWDTDDRLTSVTDPLGKVTTATWDSQSRPKSLTNAAGNSTTWTYDKLNRVSAVADASGNGLTYGLDAENRITSVTDPLSRSVNYSRDAHGNVAGMTTPKKENYTYSYDALNRLVSAADPLGRTAQFTRDPRGVLSASVLPGGVGATYGVNALGLAASITDPVGNVWGRTFDNMGRLTAASDPLGRKTSYQYNSRQHIATATLPAGTAQYSYDASGNLSGMTYSDGASMSYTWDANGRLTAATGVSLSYDAAGRLTASNGIQIAREAAGRIGSITYAAGKTVTYTYNNRGLVSQIADWVGNNTTFTYDAAGQLITMAFPNGVTQVYTWDADGRLATLTVNKGSTVLSSVTLTRDALGRVTSAARPAANIPAEAKGSLPLAYDAASQVLGQTSDTLGRVTKDTLRSYNWDLASRLTSYNGADGSAAFTYDAMGMRVSRTSGGVTQNYVWNYALPQICLGTVQSGGTDQTYYIWLPDGTLLSSISAADNTRRFYHFDESGSAMLLTDSSGAVTDTYAISVFGDSVNQTGSTATPFTFQGKYGVMRDGSTSLYYMRARYYDSATARFLSRDPVFSSDPRAINPYQFVFGNPMEHADVTGMLPEQPTWMPVQGAGPMPAGNGNGGTRLKLSFNNIPSNQPIFVPTGGFQFVSGSSAPLKTPALSSAAGVASVLEIPRVTPAPDPGPATNQPVFQVSQASLLFPFVTNQLGFDTGIAIANTSTDPFGSVGSCQSGTCNLNFYGNGAPTASNVMSPNVPTGTTYTQVVSGVAAGFQGYIVAQCTFQYAHGFAFITDGVGVNGGLSQGYLAGVIPDVNQSARGDTLGN